MTKKEYIDYWCKSSNEDVKSMHAIFNSGRYDWALFVGHLAVEKSLKALWIKNNESDFPPRTHNLLKLAIEAKYELSETEKLLFMELNDFHLESRYPDYKFDFYEKCTKEFATEYIMKISELQICILKKI
ncbi:MAG: HEPN domain-containing protein [Ignavibacteriaceae bacterium]|nr:HEPN domain-containing protein [Ignavibacteriaceae bacterium]